MVDFTKLLRDDFLEGNVVFIGFKEDEQDIVQTLFASEQQHPDLIFLEHHIANAFIITNTAGHPEWGRIIRPSIDDISRCITIPWSTAMQMVGSLRNDDIDTILCKFLNAEAYINVNRMGEDVSYVIDMIEDYADAYEIDKDPDDESVRQYFERLQREQYYVNAFIDTSEGDRCLNASHGCGVGIESSTIQPSLVYPISYIAKKIDDSGEGSYTENDFDGVFN